MALPRFDMMTADAATTEWLQRSDRARIAALLALVALTALVSAGRERAEGVVFLLFGLWLIEAIVAERFLHSRSSGDTVRTALLAADVLWITVLLHETGAAEHSGVAAYMFVVAIAAGALSRRLTSVLTAWAAVAYGALLVAESTPYLRPRAAGGGTVVLLAPSARIAAWVLGTAALIAFAYLMRTLVLLLARSDARHRLLFGASPRPMYVYDAETLRFLAVNDAAVRDYGYTHDEFLAMTLADIGPPEEELQPAISPPTGTHRHVGTWRHRRRDGSLLDVEMTSHPISVEGRPARLVVATDVTERTRLEVRLRQTQRLEALGRLAGGVAHEFNNLLAAVLGHAELLATALPVDAEGRDNVEEIVRAARRGADLTRHMLAFGRRQLLRPEVVDVSTVARDMERLLRPLLTTDVKVALILPEACWARVDRSQLELIIMNLAMNARDAMPNGGSLEIQTSVVSLGAADRARHPNVALSLGRYVRLTVSDTGVGIAPEVRERIFEPFFTTKPVGKGTGLGLSTVYGIVKQSEGYVWAYSEIGHGTSMHVYVPCAPEGAGSSGDRAIDGRTTPPTAPRDHEPDANASARPRHKSPWPATTADRKPSPRLQGYGSRDSRPIIAPSDAAVASAPAPDSDAEANRLEWGGGDGVTVLIADDEPTLRTAAARALRAAGYRVLDAEDGERALAAAADTPIDVLVTDVVMPGLGGVALAERIHARHPEVRVVYMSGYPQTHLISMGSPIGGHAFVEKPFTAAALRTALEQARRYG